MKAMRTREKQVRKWENESSFFKLIQIWYSRKTPNIYLFKRKYNFLHSKHSGLKPIKDEKRAAPQPTPSQEVVAISNQKANYAVAAGHHSAPPELITLIQTYKMIHSFYLYCFFHGPNCTDIINISGTCIMLLCSQKFGW